VRQVFISYARDDRRRVEALAERLRRLVDGVWFDSQLHGGEDWWAGILERIRGCEVFLAVVSAASMDSEACRIEREYAAAVNRTIVPVALEAVPPALPGDIATVQIVDFSSPGEQALADLARALLAAPGPPPLPQPLPADPEPPLSYLTDLVDLVSSPRELTKSEQMEIVLRLERGLQSSDHDEREGARLVLARMKNRDDLAASVERTIDLLAREQVPQVPADRPPGPTATPPTKPSPTPPASTRPPTQARPAPTSPGTVATPASVPTRSTRQSPRARPARTTSPATGPAPPPAAAAAAPRPTRRHRPTVWLTATLAAIAVFAGIFWATLSRNDDTNVSVGPAPSATAPEPEESEESPSDEPSPAPSKGCEVEPAPCQPPTGQFPGVVQPGTCQQCPSNAHREWAWLLASEGIDIIGDDEWNCNGCYTGRLVSNVEQWQRQHGYQPTGVLDRALYDCLANNDCTGVASAPAPAPTPTPTPTTTMTATPTP